MPDAPASRAATLERCKLHSHAGAWERVEEADQKAQIGKMKEQLDKSETGTSETNANNESGDSRNS